MNICINCKHAKRFSFFVRTPKHFKCESPKNFAEMNPVTGERRRIWIYCTTMRAKEAPCGPDGDWFEQKGV